MTRISLPNKKNCLKTNKDFSEYIYLIIEDFKDNKEKWENQNLIDFLEALAAYSKDIDGLYVNENRKLPEIDWNVFAEIIYAARLYE